MAYQVLSLKWRPRTFGEVIGQDHVTRTLQNAIRQDRVAHAFLFTGPRGVGKTTTARILASALICEHGPTPDPCGDCRACSEVREGRALDVIEIDGASNRGIDDIRNLREKAGYAPASAKFKIYIIDEVHMLTQEAFNALLKTLEEPPGHVKFIFATTEVKKVPITIQSRCQRFDFRLLGREEILDQLKKISAAEGIEISETALAAIAAAAEGSLRDSQTLLDQVVAFSGQKVEEEDVYQALGIVEEKTVLEFLAALLERDGAGCLRVIDRLAAAGYDPKSFVREALTGLRHLAVLKVSPSLGDLVPASREGVDRLRTLSEAAGLGRLQSLFDIFLSAETEIRQTSYPRMLLELAVLRAVRLEELPQLEEMVRTLEKLERTFDKDSRREASRDRDEAAASVGEKSSAALGNEGAESLSPPEGDPDGREAFFARLVEAVRKEGGMMLGSFLQHGRLTRQGEGELEIAFDPGNDLFIDTLGESENLTLLRRIAMGITGRKTEVRLVTREEGGENRVEKKKKETDLGKRNRREAMDHPLIQDVLDVFQAEVVDIKVPQPRGQTRSE